MLKRAVMPWPSDDPAIERWFGGVTEPVASGIEIDENTAFNCSIYYAGVRIIAETLASLPLPVYQRLDNDGKKRAYDHPLYDLLHSRPNPDMTSFTWRATMQQHVITWGNGYSGIERETSGGPPVALWPLNPSRISLKRDKATGRLYYEFFPAESSVPIKLKTDNVFHVHGLGFNGLTGYSVVQLARESLGTALAMEKFQAKFYSNAAVPSAVIQLPAELSPKARKNLKDSLQEQVIDWKNKRGPMFLEGGAVWNSTGIPQADAEYLGSRRFEVEEFARWLGLPVHFLREMTNSAVRANIEQESLEAVLYTFMPWAIRWEQELHRQLFSGPDRNRYFAEFCFDGLLRGDAATRAEVYFKGLQTARYSPNDILRLENENPIGPDGDKRFIPMNLIPLDQIDEMHEAEIATKGKTDADDASEPKTKPNTEKKAARALEPEKRRRAGTVDARARIGRTFEHLFVDAMSRVIQKEVVAGQRAIKKHSSPEAFSNWMIEFYERLAVDVRNQLEPVVETYALQLSDLLGERFDQVVNTASMDLFAAHYAKVAGQRHVGQSQNQLNALIQKTAPSELQEEISQRLSEWETRRASWAGRLELHQSGNAIAHESFRLLGVRRKRWIFRCESGSPCCVLNDRIVEMDELLVTKGELLGGDEPDRHAKRDRLHPPLRPGCVCQIEAEV